MGDQQLRGWKQIAAFLGTSPRTAQRWETELSLPVHRFGSAGRAPVFAYAHELTAWLEAQPPAGSPVEERATASVPPAPLPAEPASVSSAPLRAETPSQDQATPPAFEHPGGHAAAAPFEDAEPVIPSAAASREEASPRPSVLSRVRHSWQALAVAAAAVAVLGVSLALIVRHPGGVQARASAEAADTVPLIVFKVTSPDGAENRFTIPDGGSATIYWRGRQVRLSGRLAAEMVKLSIADGSQPDPHGTNPPVLLGSMMLRRGARATLEMPVPLTIEWVDVRRPDGRRAGHP